MKRLLLAASLLALLFPLSAQDVIYYAEDFDGGPNGWTVNTYLCEGTTGDLIGTYTLTSGKYNDAAISGLTAELSIYTDLEYTLKFEHGPHSGYSQGQFTITNGTFASSLTGADFDLEGTIDSLESNGRIFFTSQLNISQELFDQWGHPLTGAGGLTYSKTGDVIMLSSPDNSTQLEFTKISDCGQAWIWHPDGQVGYGDIVPIPGHGIASETNNNGVMSLNADWLSTLGDFNNLPEFLPAYESELISPSIDLSDATGPVYLRFNELLLYWIAGSPNAPQNEFGFDISASVSYSIDGGQTWEDTLDVNENVKYTYLTQELDVFSPVGSNIFNEIPIYTVMVELPNVAGASDVRVKFNWTGLIFYWVVDDVSIQSAPESNLALSDVVFYPPSSYQQPVTQIGLDTMGFLATVSNLGTKDMTNVTLRAFVFDPEFNQVFEDSLTIDALPAGYVDSLLVLPNVYAPEIDNTDEEYTIIYTLRGDSTDVNFTDNYDIKYFRAHPDTYAKDDGDALIGANIGSDYQIGCYYELDPLAGDGWIITDAYYSVLATRALTPGTQVITQLYKLRDGLRDDLLDFDFTSDGTEDDLEVLGLGFTEYPQGQSSADLTARIETLLGDPVPLEPGGRYFLVNVYEGATNSLIHLMDRDIPYYQTAMAFYDKTAGRWFLGINFTENRDAPYNIPVMRMSISLSTPVDETPLPETAINVFPNPTAEQLSVEVDLENRGPGLVMITNAEGRVMLWQKYESLQTETLNFNVKSYPAGSYYIRLGTEEGTKTLPFIVTGK